MDYSRHELLAEIGKKGQEIIRGSSAVIIGVGGIGCVSAQLLVRAGIGKLVIIDRDVVEESNLQRQLLFTEQDLGMPKAVQAEKRLKEMNDEVEISAYAADLDKGNVSLLDCDIVLDCTDNFETRFLINEYCSKNRIPWVYSAAVGNLCSVLSVAPSQACFRCVFPESASGDVCDSVGVSSQAVVAAAAMQVSEAFKILLGKSGSQRMLRLDLWNGSFEAVSVKKLPSCPVCRGEYAFLSGEKGSRAVRLCGSGTYQVKGAKIDLEFLKSKLGKSHQVKDFGCCISVGSVTLFSDGRAIVKAESESSARVMYAKVMG